MDSSLGLQLVIDMVTQKLENHVGFLKKLMYARPGRQEHFVIPVQTIQKAWSDLSSCGTDGDLQKIPATPVSTTVTAFSILWLKRPASFPALTPMYQVAIFFYK